MKRWAIVKKKSVKIVLANKNPVKQMETNIKPIVLGSFKNLAFTYPNKADRTIIIAHISNIWRCIMAILVEQEDSLDCLGTVRIGQGDFRNLQSFPNLY